MLQIFWAAVRRIEPPHPASPPQAGTADGDIAGRLRQAGLQHVISGALTSHVENARRSTTSGSPSPWPSAPPATTCTTFPPVSRPRSATPAARTSQTGPSPSRPVRWYARGLVPFRRQPARKAALPMRPKKPPAVAVSRRRRTAVALLAGVPAFLLSGGRAHGRPHFRGCQREAGWQAARRSVAAGSFDWCSARKTKAIITATEAEMARSHRSCPLPRTLSGTSPSP